MAEAESKNEKPEEERRFDPEPLKIGLRRDPWQYNFLKECSKNGAEGIKKWNKWRNDNLGVDIFLEGAYLNLCYLKGIHLESRGIKSLNEEETIDISGNLHSIVYLKESNLTFAELQESKFMLAVLSDAEFGRAKLQGAKFTRAILHKADLENAELEGADFCYAEIQGANFETAIVDGSTLIWKPKVDRYRKGKRFTNFSGVGLDSIRIDAATKQLLEYNIRRKNWEEWYKEQHLLRWPVWLFWLISDYGLRTWRIIATFFGLAFIFANIYYYWGAVDYYILRVNGQPGFVENLFVCGNGIEVQWWIVPLRTLYFSIVTMTTLGFGDMYANAQSIWGHILLSVQVILGYVLLGALITRFAVLFTAGGPAGKFADEKEKEDERD